MDEPGHSGDTGAADGGDSGERTRVNGWDTPDSPWSQWGAGREADDDVPAWRRSSAEFRSFPRTPAFPLERPFGAIPSQGGPVPPMPAQPTSAQPTSAQPASGVPAPAPRSPGFVEAHESGEIPPPAGSGDRPPDTRSRYADLLRPRSPESDQSRPPAPGGATTARLSTEQPGPLREEPEPSREEPAPSLPKSAPSAPPAPARPQPGPPRDGAGLPAEPGLTRGQISFRDTGLPGEAATPTRGIRHDADFGGAVAHPGALRGFDVPTPNSAPPYPYEGDLDDATRETTPPIRPRAAVPPARPPGPGARRGDRSAPVPVRESARHALDPDAPPAVETPGENVPDGGKFGGDRPASVRPSYDPSSFPRRLPYDSAPPVEDPGHRPAPAYTEYDRPGEPSTRVLPQRVPAQPDVPGVPEPPLAEPTAETPALARIATHLRRGDVLPARERQEGFDVQAILAAVREVDGVRDASLRSTPGGAHSLRLDLAEGADPAEVSRQVARLLQDRMGLDAAMPGEQTRGVPTATGVPAAVQHPTPPAPSRPVVPVTPQPAPPVGPSSTPPDPGPPDTVRPPAPPTGSRPAEPAAQRLTPTTRADAQRPPAPTTQAAARSAPAKASAPPTLASQAVAAPAKPERRADPQRTDRAGTALRTDTGSPRPLAPGEQPGPRIVIENVHVNTFGTGATVEVRLAAGGRTASGVASGPAVDGYLLRLCAMATAGAVDEILATSDHPAGPARCFVEHAAAVSFGAVQVAVVVLLLSCDGWVEQLAGSAVVTGDDRHAMVRATLAAVNRRLEALLSR